MSWIWTAVTVLMVDQSAGVMSSCRQRRAEYRATGLPSARGGKDVQELELEAWEYTAREFLSSNGYRFDTMFAADRFGSIVQYLQSGKVKRT